MSIEQRIEIGCTRCRGSGVASFPGTKCKRCGCDPCRCKFPCACPAGRFVAPSVLPLFAAGAPAARVRKMG